MPFVDGDGQSAAGVLRGQLGLEQRLVQVRSGMITPRPRRRRCCRDESLGQRLAGPADHLDVLLGDDMARRADRGWPATTSPLRVSAPERGGLLAQVAQRQVGREPAGRERQEQHEPRSECCACLPSLMRAVSIRMVSRWRDRRSVLTVERRGRAVIANFEPFSPSAPQNHHTSAPTAMATP